MNFGYTVRVTRGAWGIGLLAAGATLLALVAVVFWPSPESAEPGPGTDVLQLERERGAAPRPGASAEAPKEQLASPSAPSLPSEPGSPSASSSAHLSRSSSPPPSAEVRGERETTREGAAPQLRKLGVKKRANERAEENAASWAAEARLIDEIGIEAYDERLYQEGRSNRSEVNWVAPGSNAGQVGIQKGDVILAYGGEPVFGPLSLRETNRLFPPGGEIVVQVNRNGEILEFTMGTDKVNRELSAIVNGMTLLPLSVKPD